MSGRDGRARDRMTIRQDVDRIGDATGGRDDMLAAQWTLGALVAQGVLAICNLAETLDARGDRYGLLDEEER